MATANCTLSYVRTMDKGTNEGSATYHFGYGNAGQRWVTCYKVTVPSYTGTPSSITFSLNVNRGTAYPTNKDSTWKIGLDEAAPVWSAADGAYTAGSVWAKGNYYITGSWYGTFSGSITSTTVTKTVTISTSSAILDGGNTFYVYLLSGADTYNSIKVTSISAYVTYSSEAVTGTTLYVGTTSTPTSTTAYPTPSKRTVYYRVAGLSNPLKNYKYFKVFLASGFSMTAITDSTYGTVGYTPSGTELTTFTPSSTSSAYEFTGSFTIPNVYFPIGSNTGIVVVASTTTYPNRYWRIGARSGSTYLPVIRYIYPKATDWFLNTVNCNAKVTGKNSVTYTFTHTTKNDPKYIKWLGAFTTSVPYSTSGHNGGSTGIWDYSCGSLNISASAANTTYSFSQSGLSAGTSYTRYMQAGAQSETPYYASNYYYGLGSVSFTTDANYTGNNISATVTGSTTATINCGVSSKINLDGNIYYSTTSGLKSKPSTYVSMGSYYSIAKNLTGLTANKKHDYYFYVYSSVSGVLYQIGSVSFTTDASSYNQTTTVSSEGVYDATIHVSTPSPTTNLDGKTYISATSSGATKTLSVKASGSYNGNITIPSLSPDTEYTFYTYVKSSVTGYYYLTDTDGITFTTASANYYADCVASGITHNSAYLCAINYSSTVGLNEMYYISDEDYGSEFLPEPEMFDFEYDRYESLHLTDLIPGMTYTYYFYAYSSALGSCIKLGSVTFTTYSTVMYYGDALEPCRGYMLNPDTGVLEGICLYREGTAEPFVTSDGSVMLTSDGNVMYTTEGDIDI